MYKKIGQLGLGLVLVAALVMAVGHFATANDVVAGASDNECLDCGQDTTYPIMQPDRETIDRWIEGYNALPVATVEESELKAFVDASGGSHSMLDWLPYVPEDRHQGSCGNCWVWAGTGCMEIAHLIENDVHDRLSIQFFNSAYGEGDGEDYACCGGWLGKFADAYSGGFAVPWDNFNANWQDGNTACGGSTNVPAASIVVTPRYNISYIEPFRIVTQGVGQAAAIASIKYFLENGYPVDFGFYLPNSAAWSDFQNWWRTQPETAVWSNFYCGQEYNHDEGEGGGHEVLCVGYNDEEGTANDYWIMLNSWGTATDGIRPNGVFRVAMDINYSCELDGLSGPWDEYSLNWMILEVDFANSAPKADANGPYTADEGTAILFDASGSSDPDGHPLLYRWDFDNNGTWDTGWSSYPKATHVWCDDHTGKVKLEVWEGLATDEQLRDTDTADVTVSNVVPAVNAGPDQTVDEGDTVDFIGSFNDPGKCDTWLFDWDFGDGTTSSGSLFPEHIYGDDGVYTASLTVTDDDGGVDTDDITVTVNNVAPTIEADSMEQPNSQFILPVVHTLDFEATATDPGSDDLTFVWDWGDTTSDTTIYYNDGVGPDPYPSPEVNPMNVTDAVSHVYVASGDYTMTLTVTDDDGGVDTFTQPIHVADVAEALDITNEYIQNLPDVVFKDKADKRKASLDKKFNAIDRMLRNEAYVGMIQVLRDDIRQKVDGEIDGKPGNDWIIDPDVQKEICQKIDDITAYLNYLLTV